MQHACSCGWSLLLFTLSQQATQQVKINQTRNQAKGFAGPISGCNNYGLHIPVVCPIKCTYKFVDLQLQCST
jgi:hypothetical protein